MTLVPLLLLTCLEAGLRLCDYGHSTAFFVVNEGHTRLLSNPKFGWRFFPPDIARTPTPMALDVPKPEGTYRIVVLGESAALGTPGPSFGFSRILDVMLRETHPQARIEVINTAMVAINSHVIRAIARDCIRIEPNLFIAYIGNNEVVGPYGAGTVFQRFSGNLGLIRAGLAVRTTRSGQLLEQVLRFRPAADPAQMEWRGMEFFLGSVVAADDPRMPAVYRSFADNLNDICDTAERAGAAMVLCTVGVNLKDSAPFASMHREGLTADALRAWEQAFRAGAEAQASGKNELAQAHFERALAIDDRFADLHYRIGHCLRARHELTGAHLHFQQARDLDALRFRADSRINEIIREIAAKHGPRVTLVDIERAFEQDADGAAQLPGDEHFYEHCHLRFAGNYVLARQVFAQVTAQLPAAMRNGHAGVPVPPSARRCAELLALTPWDQYRMATEMLTMMEQPPFTNQSDHSERVAHLSEEIAQLRNNLTPEQSDAASGRYQAALRRMPDDLDIRRNYADFLSGVGAYAAAERETRALLERFPEYVSSRITLASLLVKQGRVAEGIHEGERALTSQYCDRSFAGEVHFNLGVAWERQGDADKALISYRESLRLRPSYVRPLTNAGLLLRRMGRPHEAVEHLSKVVELQPTLTLGRLNLGLALKDAGRLREAADELAVFVKLQPGHAEVESALGRLYLELGQYPAAVEHLTRALALQPNDGATRAALEAANRSNEDHRDE